MCASPPAPAPRLNPDPPLPRAPSQLTLRAVRWSQLPLELADRIFATLGLLDLSRIVAVSRFCHDRLPTAITACSLRLKLGGYANAVGLRSTNTLLAHLDAALPRLPRAIVVTWLADFDWRVCGCMPLLRPSWRGDKGRGARGG